MSFHITWLDREGQERLNPVFVDGEEDALDYFQCESKYAREISQILSVEPINQKE